MSKGLYDHYGHLRPTGKRRYPNKDAFASPALQAKLKRRAWRHRRQQHGVAKSRLAFTSIPF